MLNAFRTLCGFLIRRERQIVSQVRRDSRLRFESLENRRLLSVNAPDAIAGTIYADANNNNVADVGEGIAGASVLLFLDNGDGNFDPNNGDVQIGTAATTDANGEYCFTNLDQSATYFVRQSQQTVNGQSLAEQVSGPVSFLPQLMIDQFNTTQTTIAVPPPISTDSSSLAFPDETEVIGAERDLAVELTEGMSEVQLRVNPFNQQDVLLFDSSAGTTGQRIITWDGQDNDGDTLALGLNGRDLTVGGTLTAITMLIGVDANGGNAAVRLYQGDTNTFSEAIVPIPQTNGTATEWLNLPFSSFTGPVNANNVDAIELELLTGNSSVDGQVDMIGAAGARVTDFENELVIDLELVKSVDANEVNAGDTVTWTVTLTNNDDTNGGNGGATATATGVVVGDVLPAGVSFVSATPSNGTYSNGVWTLADGIAPGGQATLTLVTTVNSGLAGGTIIPNVAEVTAHDQADVDSTPNNDDGDQSEDDEDNAEIVVGEAVDLEVMKTANTANVEPGGQVTFTVTITNNANTANTAATGVQVTDTLPTGMTLVSGTPSGNGTFDDQTRVWSLNDALNPGAQQTLTIVADVNAGVLGNSELTNVAQVTAVNETDVDSAPNNDDGDQSEDDEASARFTVGSVIDLSLTKEANVQSVSPGGNITWTLNVANDIANANTAATNVQITDVLPAGVTVTAATPSGSGQFNNGVWSLIDPLQPGSVATLTLMTSVDNALQTDKLTNTAQVTAADQTDVDSTPNNDNGDQSEDDEAMAMVTLTPQIDLEVTKTSNQTVVQAGDQVTWVVTVLNNAANANASATGVTLTDVIPAGLVPVSVTPTNGTFANDLWTLADPLAPGASATLTLVTTVDANTSLTSITNVAQVSSANETDVDSTPGNDDGDQSEDDEDNAQITITPTRIDLELSKSVNASQVNTTDSVAWTITVTNNAANANADATGVMVTDLLPTGVTLVSSDPSTGTFAGTAWNVGTLAPGASATLTLNTTVNNLPGGTTLENTAEVSAANETDIDSTPGNDDGDQSEDDEANAVITVRSVVDLELEKSVDRTNAQINDTINWTIVVRNDATAGNTAATGVTISDALPTGTTFVSANASLGSFNNGTGVWTLGAPLQPGQSATLNIVSTIDPNAAGQRLVNTAQVATQDQPDLDSTPGDGQRNDDDDSEAEVFVQLERPMSKRSLLATS